jgi:hypothetical protein
MLIYLLRYLLIIVIYICTNVTIKRSFKTDKTGLNK